MSSKIKALIGLLVSGAFVWYLIGRGDIDWANAWSIIKHSNKLLLVLSSACATAIFALRAARWRIILPAPPEGHPPFRFSSLWQGCVIGQAATNTLPGRAGEVARPLALARLEKDAPFSTGLASVLVDRIFDGIVVLVLMFIAMFSPAFPQDAAINGRPVSVIALLGVAGLAAGLIGLFVLVRYPEWSISLARSFMLGPARRFQDPVAGFIERFASGLGVLRDGRRLALVFVWTVAHWLLCALSYWIGYKAVGLDAPASSALFVQTIIVLAVALPAAPGFVGVFEVVAVAALAIYGVPRDVGIAWALAYHVVSYIPVTALGLIYTFRLGLSLGEMSKSDAVTETANA